MTNTTFDAKLFDFSNTADLPQEIAEKLNKEKAENAKTYGALVAAAGRSVNISEIEAAAIRVFGKDNVPSQATIRKYLNDAVELGYLTKPTRQSYAGAGVVVAEKGEDKAEARVDPLAEALGG